MNSKAHRPSGTPEENTNFHALSNPWTVLAELLENEGRWNELLSIVPVQNPSARWRVAAARAYAFLGQLDLAANELQSLNLANATLEVKTIALLAEATILRRKQQWEKALKLSEAAYVMALQIPSAQLANDALFAQAVSHSEMGQIFRAIDLFQQVREAKGKISSYRKGVAALNEGWCLWDTGQIEHLREVIPFIPTKYRPKIEVYSAMLENKVPMLEEWIARGFSETLPPDDLVQILLVLSEWRFLNSYEAKDSWHQVKLQQLSGKSAIIDVCIKLLIGEVIEWPSELVEKDWRLAVEVGFLSFLSQIDDQKAAEKIYSEELSPLMRKYRMKTPLIPWWDELLKAETPWTSKIVERLSQQQTLPKNTTVFSLQDGVLSFEDQALDLNRSPISLKLLMILAGRKGNRVSKQALHTLLNGSRYHASIHDSRLHKLLKRTDDKIRQCFGRSILQMPGDNTVVLKTHLEVK